MQATAIGMQWEFWECKCFLEGGIAMRKDVLTEGAEIPETVVEPRRSVALSGDEMRAFLTFGLAASLLLVYTFAWATSLSS
jgi:hypothetical protein